jgi:hypothetical protein
MTPSSAIIGRRRLSGTAIFSPARLAMVVAARAPSSHGSGSWNVANNAPPSAPISEAAASLKVVFRKVVPPSDGSEVAMTQA